MNEYVNLTLENIEKEHICCAIGDKKHQAGVDSKKEWIKSKLKDGHIFRKLNLKNEYVLIIDYLKQNIQGTREKFENVLNLGKSATINILNEILEKDIIEKAGFSKNIVYKLK